MTDKVAFVTGGSRGLGKEMVLAFAAAGAHVVIVSRKIESCIELADHIEATTDRQALPFACNVSGWQDIDRAVHAAYERFGTIDILVNNAGMSPIYDSLVDHTEAL